MNFQQQIEESSQFLTAKGIPTTALGIVLGTGLGILAEELDLKIEIPYSEIPHFPKVTMEYQKGRLLYGLLQGKSVLMFQGRFHAYEGLTYFEITYLIRLMNALGVKTVVLSNAAGALNLSFKKGGLMLIEDHINLQGGSPLAEKGTEVLGNRFVDLIEPYSKRLNDKAVQIAEELEEELYRGVYTAVLGPQLETRAEYRFLKLIGTDAVGMSTVPEVIVANQLAMEVVAFSVLTDLCDPDDLQPIDIEDIMAAAKTAEKKLIRIVKVLILSL
jgi:purine-nucleoside phosphorylase